MFRRSLRSVSGPLRNHVCRSCLLARVIENPIQDVRFYTTAPFESGPNAESPPKPHASISFNDTDLQKTPTSENNALTGRHRRQESGTRGRSGQNNSSPTRRNRKVSGKLSSNPTVQEKRAKRQVAKQRKVASIKKKAARKKATQKRSTPKQLPSRPPKTLPSKETASRKEIQAAFFEVDDDIKLAHLSALVKEKHSGFLHSDEVSVTPLAIETAPVPNLSFGLDRVLFNPGVYHLRDPRSRVYNFDPYLGSIMPVSEFDFTALKEYITSSRDETLLKLAIKEGKKYVGSSSSMTSVLSHFHYLLSAWRAINIDTLSQGFPDRLRSFTRLLRAPAAMFLNYKDGVYAIDADKEFDTANILMNLGKSMEKLLTSSKEKYERYRRSSTNKITAEEEKAVPESYHYSTMGDFLMRSQLDAYDPRLPGTGMFDLKTRAVVSIRMDSKNFENGLGYEIKGRFGEFESYEREYYDMIRAAFLKYSLQVRMGRMDGIFVAFHNVERIFGFQYVSLPEMDQTLHGQSDTTLGDKEFQFSLALWNTILNKATARFPKQSLRFHFETRDAQTPFMYIFAEPVTEEEIEAIQTKNKKDIEEFQRRVLNLEPRTDGESSADSSTEPSTESPGEISSPGESEYVNHDTTEAPAPAAEGQGEQQQQEQEQEQPRDVFAMLLSISSTVNGRPVARPTNLTAEDKWTIEYELSEIQGPQVWNYYQACQKRREKALSGRGEDETEVAGNAYLRKLREISKAGREWRKEQNRLDAEQGIVVLGDPIAPKSS
ncbi:hypothetical protein VTN96DRAFT_2793 [Rasamsonia emersonii]